MAQVGGFALAVDAVSYLVSAVTLLAIRATEPAHHPVREARRSLRREITDGARYVLGDPLLRVLTIAPALANLFFSGVASLTVLFLIRNVGLPPGAVGVLVAAGSLGSVLGAVTARPLSRRLGSARRLWLASAATAPFGLLIPLTGPGWRLVLYVTGTLVLFAGILAYNVTAVAWRQAYCPPQILGRVVASMRFVLFGTVPLGGLLGGALATAIGVRPALTILLLGNLSSAAVLAGSRLRRSRDLPEQPGRSCWRLLAGLPQTNCCSIAEHVGDTGFGICRLPRHDHPPRTCRPNAFG